MIFTSFPVRRIGSTMRVASKRSMAREVIAPSHAGISRRLGSRFPSRTRTHHKHLELTQGIAFAKWSVQIFRDPR